MRADAVYARQSVEKRDSLSISGQIELCRRNAGNAPLLEYKDSGYSGKNTERPDFQRLMKDIRADRIGTLYVYRLDRFSRSVADFGQLWEVLQAHRVEFVSVSENFDTKTPMGRAMLHIIMVFAQLERETIAERVRDNYYRRAALGRWPGGPAPYGYDNGRVTDDGGHAVPAIIPNADAAVVQTIFNSYAGEDMSLGTLAKKLNESGVPAVKRDTWDNVTLSRILHNPAYVMADGQVRLFLMAQGVNVSSPEEDFDGVHGVMLVGKRSGGERKYSDMRDHTAAVLNSVGLVPSELWLRCQDKLSRNRQIGNSGKGKHTWLSGLLKCARCGYSLKIVTEKDQRRMLCSGRYNLAHCDASIRVDLSELESVVSLEIERFMEEWPEEAAEPERDEFAERMAEIERRTDRLLDAFAESDLSEPYLRRALGRLDKERQMLLEHRKRMESRPALPEKPVFSQLNFEEKKAVAAQFIERIEVSSRSAEIRWGI